MALTTTPVAGSPELRAWPSALVTATAGIQSPGVWRVKLSALFELL